MHVFCSREKLPEKTAHYSRSTCPLACALDLIGDHWTLLVIRDLLFLGRHEYKDMLNAEEGISSNVLSDRLKNLEENGLIDSIPHHRKWQEKTLVFTSQGERSHPCPYPSGPMVGQTPG